MIDFDLLTSMYRPVQPMPQEKSQGVSYREFEPHPELKTFIHCYWQLNTEQPLSKAYDYRVVADGCIDLFFDVAHPEESFVMGFCRHYKIFSLSTSFNYFGVRFYPSMFTQLFRINAKKLSNDYFELNRILPELASAICQEMPVNMNVEQIKFKLDKTFNRFLRNTSVDFDNRFYKALFLLLKNTNEGHLTSLLDVGISPRQLQRIFNYYIGTTPKTFHQVVRFQKVLSSLSKKDKKDVSYYDYGFFDQAHFIKAFKIFYGVTPKAAGV